MNVRTATIPRVDDEDRVRIERLSDDFSRVVLTFGYMETPNIPRAWFWRAARDSSSTS